MGNREQAVRRWFGMWLHARDEGILSLFTPDCVYTESWGPVYHGARQVKHWFDEWNTRGRVLRWDIRQFSTGRTRPWSNGIFKTGCRMAA